jgi:predicted ATPase
VANILSKQPIRQQATFVTMAQEPESTAKRTELPMRLTRLRVKNFRSIADIDIPLSPLTVLVGPNGSGKSNVVDALRFVRDVFARGLDQAVMDREGMGVIQRWGTEGKGITIGVSLYLASREKIDFGLYREQSQLDFGDSKQLLNFEGLPITIDYEFTVSSTESGTIQVVKETLVISFHEAGFPIIEFRNDKGVLSGKIDNTEMIRQSEQSNHKSESLEVGYNLLKPYRLFRQVVTPARFISKRAQQTYNWISEVREGVHAFEHVVTSALFYTLNPADLRQPQQVLKETPFDEKGRNLAAVLRRLLRLKASEWDGVRFALSSAIDGFKNIAVETVGGYLATKLLYQAEDNNPRTSYLGQESDGTIRMLGLLAALQQEPPQPFICIEEPEANIHPGALAVLAGVIDEASLRSQILVTTHSPDMLDHLPVESFLVVEKIGDTTNVGPLDSSQISSVRKQLFTPGELFRMEGLQRQAEPESAS